MPDSISPEIIGTVGFPGFVCIVLFWFLKNFMVTQQQLLTDLQVTIAQNTEMLRTLVHQNKGGND